MSSNSLQATPEMCAHCFDHLLFELESKAAVTPGTRLEPPSAHHASIPNEKTPLFVTWKKYSTAHKEYQLRGCIGTFARPPLRHGLQTYAKVAAFEDSRFTPIQAHEVSSLKCSLNLLVNFEEADDVFDWEVGTHGIHIFFQHPVLGRQCSATYLPSVMEEMEWDHNQTLKSLYRKAGWRGEISKRLLENTTLERYQSSKCELTHKEYVEQYQSVSRVQGQRVSKMS